MTPRFFPSVVVVRPSVRPSVLDALQSTAHGTPPVLDDRPTDRNERVHVKPTKPVGTFDASVTPRTAGATARLDSTRARLFPPFPGFSILNAHGVLSMVYTYRWCIARISVKSHHRRYSDMWVGGTSHEKDRAIDRSRRFFPAFLAFPAGRK